MAHLVYQDYFSGEMSNSDGPHGWRGLGRETAVRSNNFCHYSSSARSVPFVFIILVGYVCA